MLRHVKSFFIGCVLFLALVSNISAQVISTFTTVYQTTQKGGIVYLANTALGCSSNPPSVAAGVLCAAGTNVMPPAGVWQDNNFNAAFVDIDGDPSTFMSSSDSLALPACSEITKAYLFWGASGATTPSFTTCKMKINTGSYQTITAAASQTNNTGFNTYHCYADVTSLIQSGGINCRVTVADINSNQIGTSNRFGSWCIAIVYKNDLKTMRQLTIFKGLANVSGAATSVNVPITGFLTPATGPVAIEVGLYVHDGDRALVGDNLNFNGAGSFVGLTDAVNSSNDVMNSTVSYNGTLTPYRKPDMNNTAGLDADIYVPNNTAKNYIGNSATSATFQMTTGGETYLPQMVTTAIDVYEPDLRASIVARDVNGGVLAPGDIVEYKIKGINIGSDPSTNTFITDTLDIRADYIPNSTKVTFGAITGTMTDASGDDIVDYNASTRTIKIRLGSGAGAVLGGTVQNSPAGIDSTIITYSVMCTNSCIKIACSPSIQARAFIWGTGATSTNTYNNGSNPGIFDAFGCPIPGTTSSPITATACSTPLASNTGPGCNGSSVILSAPTDTGVTYGWTGPNSFTSAIQNPTLTGLSAANAGNYTVTLSVPGNSCSTALTTSLIIGACTPTAVNDVTNTIANTPVTGNAASNDLNLISPSFSITNAPANGTLTMNSSGQYTFTPASSFTGVTTATYAVCNGTFCSNATITFTVLPALVAQPDNLLTTPTTSTTGNLTTNDTGVIGGLGATYSVSITQPASSTGTFVINPATGQYSFMPNASFAGTAQTTYTICNTAVNPNVCSTSSITLAIFPNPVPVNDGTLTSQNIPVSGNASTNDTGTAGAVYSITVAPASGTMLINPATGQYTYTPNATFTGVASSTYQICNGALTTCSTAVISVSVYPTVATASDVITTTPTLTQTGTLTANDIGLTSSMAANYSVTATALPAGTGTLTVNPATGQYTFIPNTSFTGTAQTTYTLCNITGGLSQCSSTTILIQVYAQPAPVNDATTTVVNTAVQGNAATNDAGTTGASFSITGQPANGTVSIQSSTGQYTFTPATSFTGVTTATYNLCNAALGSCSTAVLSFTVHPQILANSDILNTTPTATTAGNLLTNDAGITTTLGATYSVSITQPSTASGTFVINPVNGQYTFTPNSAFAGSVQTTYTVCNTAVTAPQCSSSTITINVYPIPVPVNDNTTTVVNTSVTGNAAANDSGTAAAIYSIASQGTGGTVTINPTTGNYTFIPVSGFTGINTATYQLCNGAVTSCSSAVITISVYPALSASSDTAVTLQNTAISGNLGTNDTGILTTGTLVSTYNFAASATNPTTGVLTINSATGQFTFTPASGFSGSTTATYTVCNTNVNPQICSTATLFIFVGTPPVAVADFTQTPVNTPVSGTAGNNDTGANSAFNPVFTSSQPLAGTGSLTMNPNTGDYTFTPASGFTGTTSVTYTLCNITSPPCSTTAITFSVYPAISATDDNINTLPGITTSGNLLQNDAGILISGSLTANYSVSVTQPAAGIGTITTNPSDGSYTFTPNPAFTGTALTSYTVCNTSVSPILCSTANIVINVLPNPAPVNDNTTTVANTSVVASAGANDGGTTGASFTVIAQSSGGNLVMNAATGDYTFTPAANTSGIFTATYNLCNGAPTTCSAAVITITVFPTLTANNDIVNTSPGSTATGTLLTNDAGIVSGGNYSVTAGTLAASEGTITINAATGEYTFVPATGFTGTTSTTYTVCNTSVNPIVCSTATILLNVLPNPAPVNDATTTIVNVPVVADASLNDAGTIAGTYSIIAQSTGGSIVINSGTGQYTFTPTNNFSGVYTATYNLCNGAPVTCSNAVITVTVYPALTPTTDIIATGTGNSTTGSLLSNDGGVIAGGNYSVTTDVLPSGTGTLVIDPNTGQYTLTPASGFSGSTTITYTVCNTSVSPVVCNTAAIVINVLPNPSPVDDATVTIVNVPVNGDASLNDNGIFGGTYSITSQGNGGTITINPSTGQYTFTPATNFTGVNTATYTLCNGIPVTCSTAVISITVFPNLIASDDVINTSPGSTVNGNLLTNDAGVIPGGNYTVSVTPFATSTGTLQFNPATGQYTFLPNSNFTGTAQTTYTVCNISVTPSICSVATITVNVAPNPAPVDDATLTITGNPVSGDLSTNDSGAAGGTYSILVQPAGGSLSVNPSTGQYTFTPIGTFTGVTTATYVLCNGAPVTCSTAVLSITVYPVLQAVNDNTTTALNTAVLGTVSNNDLGLLGIGSYSFSITNLPSATGSITINPVSGSYTFVPATGFTGTTTTTYTVCQYSGSITIQCSTATITINVGARSAVAMAKRIRTTIYNADNTVDIQYQLIVKNMGNQPLQSVVVSDDLAAIIPAPANYTIVQQPSIVDVQNSGLITRTDFDGRLVKDLTTISSSLAVGRTDTLNFTIRLAPNGFTGTIQNIASVSAAGSGTAVSDTSVDGNDPDPDNDGDGTNNSGTTNFDIQPIKIGIAKSAGKSKSVGNSCYEVEFKFTVKNYGNAAIYRVSVEDNLSTTFAAANSYSVVGTPTCINNLLQPNPAYTGNGTNTNLVLSSSSLAANAVDTILLRVSYCVTGAQQFSNTAVAGAFSLPEGGFYGSDNSVNGNNPDSDNSGNPNEESVSEFGAEPELFVPEGFSPNNDGINDRLVTRGLENYPENEISILNRWGNVVYRKKQYDNSWDGTSNQGINYGSSDLPEGTYFYIIELGNGKDPLKGYIYLNRKTK